ncbi:MAG: hypothetical protein KF733_09540 [Fimbriimonadaceae bacterium]|nr:MAG: hypothetical protein KF733_09540 [Fimbriimonadaceae bacterium]
MLLVDYLASERLTSAGLFPAEYPAHEGIGGAPAVSWIRGSSGKTVKMTFGYTGPTEHDAVVTIDPCTYHTASGTFTVMASPSTFNVHFTPGGQATVEFALSGIPDFVTLGDFILPFSCQSTVTGLAGNAGTRLYLTDAKPLGSPYGRQLPVWTNVLEDACRFATGFAGASNVRNKCTYYLFWYHCDPGLYPIFFYDYSTPRFSEVTSVADEGPVSYRYNLTQLFAERTPYNFIVSGDCQDISFYLQICTSSLGVPLLAIQERADPNVGFWTNWLCGTGRDATLLTYYQVYDFNFHQHNVVGDLAFDAAAAQLFSLDGANYRNPPMSWPQTPSNSSYWQKPISPPTSQGSSFVGLVNKYFGSGGTQGETVARTTTTARIQVLR